MALLVYQVTSARGKLICVMVLVSIGMMIARSGSRGGFLGLVAVGGAMFVMVRTVSLDKKARSSWPSGTGALFVCAGGIHPTDGDYSPSNL
jgi:hypothetical protein